MDSYFGYSKFYPVVAPIYVDIIHYIYIYIYIYTYTYTYTYIYIYIYNPHFEYQPSK